MVVNNAKIDLFWSFFKQTNTIRCNPQVQYSLNLESRITIEEDKIYLVIIFLLNNKHSNVFNDKRVGYLFFSKISLHAFLFSIDFIRAIVANLFLNFFFPLKAVII